MDRWIKFELFSCGGCIREVRMFASVTDAKKSAELDRKYRDVGRWALWPVSAGPIVLNRIGEYACDPPDQADFDADQQRKAEESVELGTERKEVASEF